MKALAASGKEGLIELVMTTHAGMTTDEFTAIVTNWLRTAKHPTLKKPYTDLVFKPMLELLDYLRANEFKTFIVSGGGQRVPAVGLCGRAHLKRTGIRERRPP